MSAVRKQQYSYEPVNWSSEVRPETTTPALTDSPQLSLTVNSSLLSYFMCSSLSPSKKLVAPSNIFILTWNQMIQWEGC